MFNRLLALIILFLFLPIFIIIAIAIIIEDGYPFFFTQKRVGVNYTFFKIFAYSVFLK